MVLSACGRECTCVLCLVHRQVQFIWVPTELQVYLYYKVAAPTKLYSYYSQLSSLRSCMILTTGRCIYAFFSVFGNSASGFLYVYDLRLLPFSPLLRRLFLESNGEEEPKAAAASRSSGFGFSVVHQLVKGEVLEEWLYSIHHADSGCTVLIFAPAKPFYQARRVQSNQ